MKLTYSVAGAGLLALNVATAESQTVFAGDDFNTGGNFDSIAPDNSSTNGQFSTSFFDRFGVMDPNAGNIPFDFLDDSVLVANAAGDRFGIFQSTDRDPWFGIADLENNANPAGTGTATWTFDVTGYENLSVGLDIGAVGNFTDSETLTLTASIDGGPAQTIFSGAGVFDQTYTVTMEGGVTYDRYQVPNAFFDETLYSFLLQNNGPFVNGNETIDFSPDDVNKDGLLDNVPNDPINGDPIRIFTSTNNTTMQTFTDQDYELFEDQFVLNGIGLDNELQTITAPVSGTGSTLTLQLDVTQNGSLEVIAFDDLTISGDLISVITLAGDYNNNQVVDAADYTVWQDTFGDLVTPGTGADGNNDGVIDAADYTVWQDNFGNTTGMSSAAILAAFPVPEPGMGLTLAGLCLFTARRRSRGK